MIAFQLVSWSRDRAFTENAMLASPAVAELSIENGGRPPDVEKGMKTPRVLHQAAAHARNNCLRSLQRSLVLLGTGRRGNAAPCGSDVAERRPPVGEEAGIVGVSHTVPLAHLESSHELPPMQKIGIDAVKRTRNVTRSFDYLHDGFADVRVPCRGHTRE